MDREVMMQSEYLLYASLLSMVEFNENIFAAGNCYDKFQYPPYVLFCPYAYRLLEGRILVKNLAVEYKYLGNNSEWFFLARKNAETVINKKKTYRFGKYPYCEIYSSRNARTYFPLFQNAFSMLELFEKLIHFLVYIIILIPLH